MLKHFTSKILDTKNKTDFRKPWNLNKSLLNDDKEARNWSFGADIKNITLNIAFPRHNFFRRSTENIGRLAKAQFPE